MEITVPSLLRIKPDALHKIGKYLRGESFKNIALYYGEGTKELFDNTVRISLETALLHYSEIKCVASFHHTPAYIRKCLDIVSKGHISAEDFVNREEPLHNLMDVMRHLMSHNGHMKTAIIP